MIEFGIGLITVIFVFCKFCGKHTNHKVEQDSKYWETHWCESCHIGTKFKTK